LEWHLRKAWAPLLFADENPQKPEDPVTQATRSTEAVRKARSRQTKFGDPAHSFRTLMDHLARLRVTMTIAGSGTFQRIAEPTPIQARPGVRQVGTGPVDSSPPPIRSKKARDNGLFCALRAVTPG
jgi:hypothetical protein